MHDCVVGGRVMSKKNVGEERLALAERLREIRNNLNYTQEKFAEILGISLTAYKKLESAENQITLKSLRILEKQLNISADYLIFGRHSDFDETWKMIQNCSEQDKMRLMLRMYTYFTKGKDAKYQEDSAVKAMDEIILKVLE